ncbi:MAG: hypothetical protein HY898_34200 [Deltaproteobacteria bacterium]|nr:hypothetical protein [Deltaproteobacteria bacterium]
MGAPTPERDAYADLLRETRGLRGDEHRAREAFFARLPADKREALFELEILLKGMACFANPRNHPGQRGRVPIVAVDFHEPLAVMTGGIKRISYLARSCLGERDRTFVFHRYLETVLPEDAARTRLVRQETAPDSPEGALLGLRRSFTNLTEVAEGLHRLTRVPFRLFYATASVAQREIAQNTFFNPLSALEFRPEFDRISSSQVLDIIQRVPGDQAQRLVALTFLSLFRMLRYLKLIEEIAAGMPEPMNFVAGRIYLVLSVLRSDARALSNYLRRNSGELLADSFEHDLLHTPANDIHARYETLRAVAHRLIEIRGAFECINANLRLELRRVYDHVLPAPEAGATEAELRRAAMGAVAILRPALQNVVLFFGKTLGARLEEGQVFDDKTARRQLSERLRQNVWMFSQIVRAFAVKARHAQASDERWASVSGFQFVREFLAYFRAMGYPLLRAADYPRFEAFVDAMTGLQETDLLDPGKLERAIAECEAFHEFLVQLLDQVGRREELAGTVFDKRAAAAALRLYLGE